jgi:hypothetical protein
MNNYEFYLVVYNELIEEEKNLNMDVRKKIYVFAKCIACESLKDLISKVGKKTQV